MRSMSSLIHKLKSTYTDLQFVEAREFSWSPSEKTVYYVTGQTNSTHLLLHELAHALLGHREYRRDIELVAMETAAWDKAKEYAETYKVRMSEPIIQDHLDTYREWLHARSTCPHCSANGYQTEAFHYQCPACSHEWRVNEARICALRRYKISKAN